MHGPDLLYLVCDPWPRPAAAGGLPCVLPHLGDLDAPVRRARHLRPGTHRSVGRPGIGRPLCPCGRERTGAAGGLAAGRIPLPTHGGHASATGRRRAYFFFRRALRPFRAITLSIAKSSSLRPCLMRAESHRGRAPRPAHVSPPGPRYLGGTLRPFSAERRPNPVRKFPAAPPLSAPRRESCFSSSLRF